jgi:tRNA threonylcarbamoyladenosine biosynthesis protein TsaE
MPTVVLSTADEAGTQGAGVALAALLRPGDVLSLSGDLGAGKTRLVKGIAKGFGVIEPVTSPTFNILLVHEGRDMVLHHVDLYRLDRPEQLEDIDFFGIIEAGGVTAVEWGNRFPEVVKTALLDIELHIVSDNVRRLAVAGRAERGRELALAWADACRRIPGVAVLEASRP